jgi:hypothetical protein
MNRLEINNNTLQFSVRNFSLVEGGHPVLAIADLGPYQVGVNGILTDA